MPLTVWRFLRRRNRQVRSQGRMSGDVRSPIEGTTGSPCRQRSNGEIRGDRKQSGNSNHTAPVAADGHFGLAGTLGGWGEKRGQRPFLERCLDGGLVEEEASRVNLRAHFSELACGGVERMELLPATAPLRSRVRRMRRGRSRSICGLRLPVVESVGVGNVVSMAWRATPNSKVGALFERGPHAVPPCGRRAVG
jgi:hypothetical protein